MENKTKRDNDVELFMKKSNEVAQEIISNNYTITDRITVSHITTVYKTVTDESYNMKKKLIMQVANTILLN